LYHFLTNAFFEICPCFSKAFLIQKKTGNQRFWPKKERWDFFPVV